MNKLLTFKAFCKDWYLRSSAKSEISFNEYCSVQKDILEHEWRSYIFNTILRGDYYCIDWRLTRYFDNQTLFFLYKHAGKFWTGNKLLIDLQGLPKINL